MTPPDLTNHPLGLAALVVFLVAYAIVLVEEFIHLRKSKPVVLASGAIWILVALAWRASGLAGAEDALNENLLEYARLMLFLLVAMTFVNTLQERNVFAALRGWLVGRGFGFRATFWITGALAFALSPVLDNLTTALVMGAVALSVGREEPKFVVAASINIVVAANAGGAFSPFGDVTTLMVWQRGVIPFADFLPLFVPSLVNWLVPAVILGFAVPAGGPNAVDAAQPLKPGAAVVVALFAATIAFTVALHNFLHLPAYVGMMTGLGLLAVHGYFLRQGELALPEMSHPGTDAPPGFKPAWRPFDIFISMKRAEWDTLLFFYGVMLCVGGLGALGYLAALSSASYGSLGPTVSNVLVGLVSAVVDNIPVMYAVLAIRPDMSQGQWLLVTLTAGVGGSLLSIGSAAGVALMGQARGAYTFFAHLRWTWAIALGYAASIWAHFLLNARSF